MPATFMFQPVASTWNFLKDLAKRVQAEIDDQNCFAYLRQRLSLAVQATLPVWKKDTVTVPFQLLLTYDGFGFKLFLYCLH